MMIRSAAIALLMVFVSSAALGGTAQVKEAQLLLNVMGYDVGAADGAAGRRTNQAMEDFLSGLGQAFDGEIDAADLDILRTSSKDYEIILRRPGQLFDHAHGRESRCNALGLPLQPLGETGLAEVKPIRAFSDATSIGESVQRNQVEPWLQSILALATRADTLGDAASAKLAIEQLRIWADANALAETALDNSYKGAGNAEGYDAKAPAPALDMENTIRAAQAAIYAVEMLDPYVSPDDREAIAGWSAALLRKYGPRFAEPRPNPDATGIWSFDGRPAMVLAIEEGDAETYAGYVKAFYALFRDRVSDEGVISLNAYRGDRALAYQTVGINGMASVFALVEGQGSRVPVDIERRLHAAVNFLMRADLDANVIKPYAERGYNNPGRGDNPERYYRRGEMLWWAPWYLARFPDHENSKLVRVFLKKGDLERPLAESAMSSVTIPYPVNCYVAFDMSDAALEEAIAFVRGTYGDGAVADLLPKREVAKLTVRQVYVGDYEIGDYGASFGLVLRGATLDGKRLSAPNFGILSDFDGKPDTLRLFRITIPAWTFRDLESSQADFSSCDEITTRYDGDELEELRLMIGFEADTNECVLSRLGPTDVRIWEAIYSSFDQIMAALQPGEGSEELREIYSYVP